MNDRLDLHLYLHLDEETFGRADRKLDTIIALLTKGFKHMAHELTTLETQVRANTDAEQSAVMLLGELHDLLIAAQNDPARLQAVIDQLGTSKAALAAAIVANTPASPA